MASVIKQIWCRTGNIIEAWQSGCFAADLLNQRIIDDEGMGTSDCGCAEEMRQSEIHSCSICGRPAFCASLQYVPELEVEDADVLELYERMHAIAKIMIGVPYTIKTRLSQKPYQRPAERSSEITTEQCVADANSTGLDDDEEWSLEFDDEMTGDDDLYTGAGNLEGDAADEDED